MYKVMRVRKIHRRRWSKVMAFTKKVEVPFLAGVAVHFFLPNTCLKCLRPVYLNVHTYDNEACFFYGIAHRSSVVDVHSPSHEVILSSYENPPRHFLQSLVLRLWFGGSSEKVSHIIRCQLKLKEAYARLGSRSKTVS